MSRHRSNDLTDFQTWLGHQGLGELSAQNYTSLVRRVIAETDVKAESLLLYERTLNANTAAQMRASWRWFTEYALTKDLHLPNPFGPRRRAAPRSLDALQRLAAYGFTPGSAPPGSALGSVSIDHPAPPVPQPVGLPENVLRVVKKWANAYKLGAEVLVQMRWNWTRFEEDTGNWVTAHPTMKYTWVVMPPAVLDALGEWGYETPRPTEGPLIPKSPGSSEPFPKIALRLLIEADT